jgi:DNA-damage-inducible protein D
MVVLNYTEWRNFTRVLTKAREACETSSYAVSDHCTESSKLIEAGKGAKRELVDYHLSRYACYLIVQNGDPEKPAIAARQTYFAIRTREAELTDYNKQLASAAYDAGALTQQDFGIFQDHGYRGLYDGETSADIHLRKGLKKGQRILDYMGTDELAANLFRAS